MNLLQWAGRVLQTVEQDGQAVARVRLMASDGAIWHTWEAPLPDPEAWTREAEAVLDELARELPPRRHALAFVAEDQSGGIVSQCPKTVAGLNRGAGEAAGAEHRAFAEAMSSIQRTTDHLLNSANVQIQTLTKTVETLGAKHSEAIEMIVALQEQCMLRQQQAQTQDTAQLIQSLIQQVPQVLDELQKVKRDALARRPQPQPPAKPANGKDTTHDSDSPKPQRPPDPE